MKVQDLIDDLGAGELSSHGIFINYPQITQLNSTKLMRCINSALTALYTRFALLTKEVVVNQLGYITHYRLNSLHSVINNQSKEVKYILDSPNDKFNDDIIRIEAVYDECGVKFSLNNTTDCRVALTPAMDVIEIPNPVQDMKLFVIYRAKHPTIERVTDTILLPPHFVPALCVYVAHRVYSAGTTQEHMALSQQMLQQYEMMCTEYQLNGVVNEDDGESPLMFARGGWI